MKEREFVTENKNKRELTLDRVGREGFSAVTFKPKP